jgi:hypothetical protein
MTLLLVLSDEAEVGGDWQRLRYRARFCHLEEAKREGKGKGVDQGLVFLYLPRFYDFQNCQNCQTQTVNQIPTYQKLFFRKIHYPSRRPIRRGF